MHLVYQIPDEGFKRGARRHRAAVGRHRPEIAASLPVALKTRIPVLARSTM
jgi:hypothetical protein